MNTINDYESITENHLLDATGFICPEPVQLLHKAVRQADSGEIIKVVATDPTTVSDITNFCHHLGHTLLAKNTQENFQDETNDGPLYLFWIQKK